MQLNKALQKSLNPDPRPHCYLINRSLWFK